jgi:ankyrin repeat protein
MMVEDFGAKINVQNEQGTTPLFHAVSVGRRKIVDYLVSKGADVNLSKEGGWKPIHAACYNEFPKLTAYLVGKGTPLRLFLP